jgi:hypothetical protein
MDMRERPAAGKIQAAGRFDFRFYGALEHAEHDGPDKGQRDIDRNNAQFADERTREGHWEISLFTWLPAVTTNASKPFRTGKVSAAVVRSAARRATWLKNPENKALKSP